MYFYGICDELSLILSAVAPTVSNTLGSICKIITEMYFKAVLSYLIMYRDLVFQYVCCKIMLP